VQDRLRDRPADDEYLGSVVNEALRVWPLFGIAHRITTADIDVTPPIAAGSVVLFDYLGFHRGDGADPAFDPARWDRARTRPANFIPFGVSANRPCPARGVAPVGMHVAAREVLRRYALASSVSHTRSLANRAPVFLTPAGAARPSLARLALMRAADRWADVWRSVVQLVLGTVMVWDARRLALCRTYFAAHPEHLPVPAPGRAGGQCPVAHHR
jgi:hypothetical protein